MTKSKNVVKKALKVKKAVKKTDASESARRKRIAKAISDIVAPKKTILITIIENQDGTSQSHMETSGFSKTTDVVGALEIEKQAFIKRQFA